MRVVAAWVENEGKQAYGGGSVCDWNPVYR